MTDPTDSPRLDDSIVLAYDAFNRLTITATRFPHFGHCITPFHCNPSHGLLILVVIITTERHSTTAR